LIADGFREFSDDFQAIAQDWTGQLDYLPEILSMAKEMGLVGFSGVAGEPI
jgi:hypothetical protein